MVNIRFCLLIALLLTLPPPTPTAERLPTYADVAYVPEGDPHQILDLYLPDDTRGALPTLLLIHGGGFIAGSKVDVAPVAGDFAKGGYAVVSMDYRLAPDYTYPAQIQDVFCALAWIHANAESYHLDTERIAVLGESVGGTLAAMLAAVDETELYLENCPHTLPEEAGIQGVVLFYPVIDLTLDAYESFFTPYMGVSLEQSPDLWAEASPLHWLDGSEPPFLLVHGTWDVRVPIHESETFVAALEAVGVPVELVQIPRADHRFLLDNPDSPAAQSALTAAADFLTDRFASGGDD